MPSKQLTGLLGRLSRRASLFARTLKPELRAGITRLRASGSASAASGFGRRTLGLGRRTLGVLSRIPGPARALGAGLLGGAALVSLGRNRRRGYSADRRRYQTKKSERQGMRDGLKADITNIRRMRMSKLRPPYASGEGVGN